MRRNDILVYEELHKKLLELGLLLSKLTDCSAGHEFSTSAIIDSEACEVKELRTNVYVRSDGAVECKICRNLRAQQFRDRRAQARAAKAAESGGGAAQLDQAKEGPDAE